MRRVQGEGNLVRQEGRSKKKGEFVGTELRGQDMLIAYDIVLKEVVQEYGANDKDSVSAREDVNGSTMAFC